MATELDKLHGNRLPKSLCRQQVIDVLTACSESLGDLANRHRFPHFLDLVSEGKVSFLAYRESLFTSRFDPCFDPFGPDITFELSEGGENGDHELTHRGPIKRESLIYASQRDSLSGKGLDKGQSILY